MPMRGRPPPGTFLVSRREELVRLLGLDNRAQALEASGTSTRSPKQALDPRAVGSLATKARLDITGADRAGWRGGKPEHGDQLHRYRRLTGRLATFDNAEGTLLHRTRLEIDVRLPSLTGAECSAMR